MFYKHHAYSDHSQDYIRATFNQSAAAIFLTYVEFKNNNKKAESKQPS